MEKAAGKTTDLLFRILTFAGEIPSQLPWHIAPYDSEMTLEDSSQGNLIAEVSG